MSENVETYHRTLDAFNRRDKEAWLAANDPELENHPPREWPEAAVLRGAAPIWDFFVEIFESWEREPLEIVAPIVEGENTLVAQLRAELTGKASGATIEWGYHHLVEFRDGRAVRMAWFSDRGEALEAAGISEPAAEQPG